MCGIIGRHGPDDGVDELVAGLQNLEYRGYDSAGIAVRENGGLAVHKREGDVAGLVAHLETVSPTGDVGVGHTRWSTHGPPSDANAHPHTDCAGEVAVVHNGIIDNHDELRRQLRDRGHEFASDTDTEVVPHLVEEYRDRGYDREEAFRRAVARLTGSYAIVAIYDDGEELHGARSGSPLVLGVGEDTCYLASDVPAFLEYTDSVVYVRDGEFAVVDGDGYRIADADGVTMDRSPEPVDWDMEDAEKGGFDHYMLKEIHEQPDAVRGSLRGRLSQGDEVPSLECLPSLDLGTVDTVQFVACGTSYHAAMYVAQVLQDLGVRARAYLGGEYAATPAPISDGTLVVAVTQSGETADTLAGVRSAAAEGARTLAVTNTVGSTVTRECDESLFIRAGPEIGVAATKTFSSQVVTLSLLADRLVAAGATVDGSTAIPDREQRLRSLTRLPEHVQQVVEASTAAGVVDRYGGASGNFFIGRGVGYPVALEAALKFKEISYEHAEGFAASELKHGPLALVTPDTPVYAIFTGVAREKTLGNVREVQSRGAPVVAVTSDVDGEIGEIADATLAIPDTHPQAAGVLANVQLQLVAYHAARQLGRPIDKPRNLAKCVTVE